MVERFVHCHTGSLEIDIAETRLSQSVHCHTGSLEKVTTDLKNQASVHCHTGSLEISGNQAAYELGVHCHTGSLESTLISHEYGLLGSLPYRQLRKVDNYDPSIAATIYADGRYITTIYHMNVPVPLPSGFTARTWEIEIRGNQMVTGIVLAATPTEIAEG